jgi:hypothetical protein
MRIAFSETDLRERAKRLGAVWRPAQKLWEITWGDAKRLGLADREPAPDATKARTPRYVPAYPGLYPWMVASTNRYF